MIAHTGGIAYDDINELLWITAKDGNIRCYDIKDLEKDNKNKSVSQNCMLTFFKVCSPRMLTAFMNFLYIFVQNQSLK